jgi:cyclophilin family peptidyl-prolyl cis-trans isomerase
VLSLKVVFGEVIDGMDTVKKIEALGSQSGRTEKKITIAESGELGNDQPKK